MALEPSSNVLDRPMSIGQIVKLASAQQIDLQYSLSHYFRSANLMVKQANIYEHEGNDQMAYFLLYRHANLILDDLTKHPHAKDLDYRQAWADARKALSRSLAKLEVLKPRINARFEQYTERRKTREARTSTKQSSSRPSSRSSLEDGMRRMSLGPESPRSHSPLTLDASQHRDIAVRYANREIYRRSGRGSSTDGDEEDISSSLIRARQQAEGSGPAVVPPWTSSQRQPSSTKFSYPSVTAQGKDERHSNGGIPLPSFTSIQHQPLQPTPPQRPPKTAQDGLDHVFTALVPSKINHTSPAATASSIDDMATQQFASSSTLESGLPLRTIFLPQPLRRYFLTYASANTSRNLETLGLLAGTLIRNALFITKLILPPQNSTSDTCEMIDESVLWEYIDGEEGEGEGLMVLGWIHTHPTQTCFMSSRDLHSHVWYQVSLAESVAIVCAPSKHDGEPMRDEALGDWGCFRLTDPPGVGVIKKCEKTGIFHPHEDAKGGLYTDCAGRPGHVVEVEGLVFDVVDLRDRTS